MNKPHSEQELQRLYSQSKAQHTLPKEVANKILAHGKKHNPRWQFVFNWQLACAALIFGFIWFQPQQQEREVYSVTSAYTQDERLIYYHDVNLQQSDKANALDAIESEKNAAYTDYLASLAQLKNAHKLTGIVKQSDQDVVVEICQLGLIQLSEDLLRDIENKTKRSNPLFEGDNIMLLTDNNGKVVAIEQGGNLNQCAE